MSDRPQDPDRPSGQSYDWLYGPSGGEDDDATQRLPVSGDARRDRRGGHDPDATRILPAERPARAGPLAGTAPSAPNTPAAPPPVSRPPRRRRRWGRVVVLVLLLWLVFLVAVPIWAWTRIDNVDAAPDGSRPEETPGTTYLLVGSDSREDLSAEEQEELGTGAVSGDRPDTIMLLHVPRFSGPTLLLSLPRDSIVTIPGVGDGQKINSAFAFGGPELLVRTVEEETGLRVDSYVEIGLGGFVGVVDAVGGIEICPETAMTDPQADLDIEAGCQEADGPTALGYVRSRKTSGLGDIDRVARQREVVGGITSSAISPWTFLNPVRYVRLAASGAAALRIGEDVGPFDLARFAWGMRSVTGDDGLTCTVPIVDLAVTWDEEAAAELFALIAEDNTEEIECSPSGGV